jgi:hypothetical protein
VHFAPVITPLLSDEAALVQMLEDANPLLAEFRREISTIDYSNLERHSDYRAFCIERHASTDPAPPDMLLSWPGACLWMLELSISNGSDFRTRKYIKKSMNPKFSWIVASELLGPEVQYLITIFWVHH